MFEDLKKATSAFKKAKSIVIFSPKINTIDKVMSIIALGKICAKEGKSFQILSPNIPKASIDNLLKREGLSVVNKPFSQDYVVSVDYSVGNIEKVVCKKDEENKKLNFVITPKDEVFNFDNVELISGGSSFDLIFSINLTHVDNLDEDFKTILKNTDVISLTRKETDFGKYKFLLSKEKSYSEVIYEFIKTLSDSIPEDVLNVLLQGVISKYKLLENGNRDGWLLANQLIENGSDFNKAMRTLYYSKDYENFQLQKKVFENIRVDKEKKVIWSEVSSSMGLDFSRLDIKGRILFNICGDFDIAFVIYNLDGKNIKVVFESNDTEKYSALRLINLLPGYGTKSRVVLTNKGISVENFEREFFENINSLYGISVL